MSYVTQLHSVNENFPKSYSGEGLHPDHNQLLQLLPNSR